MDENQGAVQSGKIEILQGKIETMLRESNDPGFSHYLCGVRQKAIDEQHAIDLLSLELENNYQIFKRNQQRKIAHVYLVPQATVEARPVFASNEATKQKKNENTVEFKIGAGLFSVIGILFILVSFVMLGMTVMDNLIRGICLYGISIIIMLVSEQLLRKRLKKFAEGITGLSICGLYASTMLNYMYYHNFNSIVSMIIAVAITVFAILISRKKESVVIQVVAFLGCYISFIPMGGFREEMELLTIAVIIFMVNLMVLCLPSKELKNVVHITHMIANTVFSVIVTAIAIWGEMDGRLIFVYLLSNLVVLNLIIYKVEKVALRLRNQGTNITTLECGIVYVCMLVISSLLFVISTLTFRLDIIFYQSRWQWILIAVLVFSVISFIFSFLLRKTTWKWISYYVMVGTVFLTYLISGEEIEITIALLALLVISKLLARCKELSVSEMIITVIVAVVGLRLMETTRIDVPWIGTAFLGAYILSILTLYYYKTFYQILITFVVTNFVWVNMGDMLLRPAVIVSVLFILIFIFNSVKAWQGRKAKIYNYINLILMAIQYVLAIGCKDYFNYGILTILGLATIATCFQEKFYLDFKYKHLIVAIFLSYMALISRMELRIITSILLMLIAIGSVIAGFLIKRKEIRFYGLGLTLVVCAKIMLYDFVGIATFEKMLLFLIVGIIILGISGIYIVLEKKAAE